MDLSNHIGGLLRVNLKYQNYFEEEEEESIEDIQRQISQLKTRVMEYEYTAPETDYDEKLKELINEPPPAHKIILKNYFHPIHVLL